MLAVGLGFAWGFLVQLTAFWITDVRGPNQLAWIGAGFLSGMFSTIVAVPGVARGRGPSAAVRRRWCSCPAEVFLGKHRGLGSPACAPRPGAWLVALLALGRVVLARAVRKLVVLGG